MSARAGDNDMALQRQRVIAFTETMRRGGFQCERRERKLAQAEQNPVNSPAVAIEAKLKLKLKLVKIEFLRRTVMRFR